MKRFFSLFSVIFVIVASYAAKKEAYDYRPVRSGGPLWQIENNWIISNTENNFDVNKSALFDLDVRGMAARDGIMYFINRETKQIVRVDGETGEMLDPIVLQGTDTLFKSQTVNAEGETVWADGTTLPYNDIKFDQAGNCLIGACMRGATVCQTFYIYIVDLETGVCTKLIEDVLWENPGLNEVKFRFDAFGAAGDVTKNGVVMAADANGSWNVYRWLIEDGVAGEGEQVAVLLDPAVDQSLFVNAAGYGTAPQIFPQDEVGSLFYVDGFNTLPMLFYGNPEEGAVLIDDFINVPTGVKVWNNGNDTISMTTNFNGLVEFQVGEEYFLLMAATHETHNIPTSFALYKFADESREFDDMEPLWYFPHNGLGLNTNGCRTVSVSVETGFDYANIYVYAPNNGYASYTLKPNYGCCLVDVKSNDTSMGTVSGGGVYCEDEHLYAFIKATPNDGYIFGHWSDGEISESRYITSFVSDTTLIAYFYPASGECGDNLTWKYSSNTLTISGTGDMWDYSSFFDVPWINISSYIHTIKFPEGITSIGKYAFWACDKLASVDIPAAVTKIESSAFGYCENLKSVTMHSNMPPTVGYDVFHSIASDAVLYIPTNANLPAYQSALGKYFSKIVGGREPFSYILTVNFYENQGSVEILQQPDWDTPAIIKATPKDGYVFGRWDDGEIDNLRTINVTSDTTMWAYFAPTSGECGDNLTWKYSNNTLTISGTGDMWDFSGTDVPWEDLCGQVHTISLPTGITSISDRAFFAFTEITSIDLPSSLISMGSSAFMYCEKLTSITIPDKVTMIGNSAFHGCTNLKHVSIGKALKEIGHSNYSKNDVFRNCTNLTSVEWNARECADFDSHERTLFGSIASQITSFTFGKDVQYIPQYLCYELDKITSITIPNRVTKIGNFAFEYCSLLSNLNIGGSVEEIGMFTFANCDKLTNITIPDGVTSIGNYAFSDCRNLTSVSIGYGLKHFGYLNDGSGAFSNCPKLTSVVWNAQACADFEVSEEAPFYGVAQQITSFTFGNRVEHIPAFLCYDMKKLATLQFPSTLKVIGESAFESCESLKHVAIPDQVTTIHNWAFAWCLGLTQVTFGERLQQIGSGAFCDCTSIKEMTSNASQVPEITYATFDNVEPSTTVYVKEPLIEQYKQHPYWGKFNIVAVKSPVDNISYSEANTHKLLRNGQLIIVRNGVEYNAMGAEVR